MVGGGWIVRFFIFLTVFLLFAVQTRGLAIEVELFGYRYLFIGEVV
jgi:hypothetical protein